VGQPGVILNRKRAQQVKSFANLRFKANGKVTPTDIDGYLEFDGQLAIFIELKHDDAPMSYGQRTALRRLVCNHRCPTIVFLCEHNVDNTDNDIDADNCTVSEYLFNDASALHIKEHRSINSENSGKWVDCRLHPMQLKQAIEWFLETMGFSSYIYKP
jgi:hypothetical protein